MIPAEKQLTQTGPAITFRRFPQLIYYDGTLMVQDQPFIEMAVERPGLAIVAGGRDDKNEDGIDPGFRASREFEIPAGFREVFDLTIGDPDVHYQFPTPPTPQEAPAVS